MLSQENLAIQFAEHLVELYPKREIKEAVKPPIDNKHFPYQADPVGFGEKVLGESYTDDVKRMMVSVRDNVITIAKSGNATGKTHGAARVAVWWYRCFPNSQVYTAAAPPESNLRKLLWGEIGSIVTKHHQLFDNDQVKILHIERGPQSYLTGVTIPTSGTAEVREAKFSGKHAPYLLFILDEADAIPHEVYKGIESCMSGGHARLLVMFNPKARVGPVYRMERDHQANIVSLSAFNHPNVITGEDRIPAAVTRETTVGRVNKWCRPLVEGEPITDSFELPKFLEGTVATDNKGGLYPPLVPGYYKIKDPEFSYMVLGQYPAQGTNQLISMEWIYAARERWDAYTRQKGQRPPDYTLAIIGLDVAEMGVDSNALCARYGGYVEPIVTWGGIDTMQTGDRANREFKTRQADVINVDATGVGAGVAPYLVRLGVPARAVKVASSPTDRTEQGEFKILRDQIWWACREWLRTDPGAMLPPDEDLVQELQTPTYEVQGKYVRVMPKETMRELLRRSPDRAESLILTFGTGPKPTFSKLEEAGTV